MTVSFSCCSCIRSTSGDQDDKDRNQAPPSHEAATVLAPEQISIATSEPELDASDTSVVGLAPESLDRILGVERNEDAVARPILGLERNDDAVPRENHSRVGFQTIEESEEVMVAGAAVAPEETEPSPSADLVEHDADSRFAMELAQAIRQGLPTQAQFERRDCVVDTFIEFRSWLRRITQQGNLVAAGLVLDASFKRAIFSLLAGVAQNRLRQSLAREAFAQLASIDEWTRGGALDDGLFVTAMGEMPGQSLDQRDPGLGESARASPAALAPSSHASRQPELQEVSEPGLTEARVSGEGAGDETQQATTKCIICSDAPAVMTFVHGSSGHTACCPACAGQIQARGYRRCPVCRQHFSSVIRNFGV